ncbi:hypothetical protein TcWFU_003304 [Taenia crassiceps]|uniref:Uncharacterized protein n=1 Tax=Taenia crassiceps TaxID=6207 RepID=A0ABR4QGF6_9CEST
MSESSNKAKLPVTEYVDTEERYCYGIVTENENCVVSTEVKTEKTAPQPGLVGKTGHLIGAIGSGIWSGATGAVSLGVSAVSTGVSAGSSIASGVISYFSLPRRVASTDKPSQPHEDITEQKPATPPAVKSGILSKVFFRATTKDKAD